MSRIYEALRRAEGAPVEPPESDGVVVPRGVAKVTLDEYPREAPVQAERYEPSALAPPVRQEPLGVQTERLERPASVSPARLERAVPLPTELFEPPAPLLPVRPGSLEKPPIESPAPPPPRPAPVAPVARVAPAAPPAPAPMRPAPPAERYVRGAGTMARDVPNIWSSSVEGIASASQRVERGKGRWLKSLFRLRVLSSHFPPF